MREIDFLHVANIPEPPDGHALAACTVSHDGAGLFLFVDEQSLSHLFARYEEQDGASFPETTTSEGAAAQFVEMTPDATTRIDLSGIDVTFPMIDRLPDGRILVVGARAERHEDGTHDLNGQVFASDGQAVGRILLGDGISRLACDGQGRIWVSYFDEGVYGNLGWGGTDQPAPVGASGLACFDSDGRVLWEFAADGADGEPRYIDDCYAMNVSRDRVWIYYYSDFDLCQIDTDFRCRFHRTDLEGCHGLAVDGSSVLLTGQYGDDPNVGYLGTIEDGLLADVRKARFAIPALQTRERIQFLGRGSTLNLFHNGKWLQHDMALHSA